MGTSPKDLSWKVSMFALRATSKLIHERLNTSVLVEKKTKHVRCSWFPVDFYNMFPYNMPLTPIPIWGLYIVPCIPSLWIPPVVTPGFHWRDRTSTRMGALLAWWRRCRGGTANEGACIEDACGVSSPPSPVIKSLVVLPSGPGFYAKILSKNWLAWAIFQIFRSHFLVVLSLGVFITNWG